MAQMTGFDDGEEETVHQPNRETRHEARLVWQRIWRIRK